MNYRHAFHAGNHTEIFKHTALVLLLQSLRLKPKPFMVLDTHAGCGLYDLGSAEALRTGEATDGALRLDFPSLAYAAPYADAVASYIGDRLYPGSPTIVADVLRPTDRLVACELHETDVDRLRRLFASNVGVSVHHRDGYEAMLALVPPRERRGLVFVDPPFENADEVSRLSEHLVAAARKWPTGIFAAWYPIKDDRISRRLTQVMSEAGFPNVLRAELVREPPDGQRLVGGGMVFVNPPWQFEEDLRRAAGELLTASSRPQGRFDARWIAPPQ